jgi:energy-coupling factor transporter ATP-binding protein EcfA2
LSGSERQRLKLATRRAEEGDVDVLDEPTSGLHLADVERLPCLLDRLVDSGKSAIVIAQVVMAHADWIIDLGHGAGHDGGRIVFEGTPPSSSPPAPLAAWACLDGSRSRSGAFLDWVTRGRLAGVVVGDDEWAGSQLGRCRSFASRR